MTTPTDTAKLADEIEALAKKATPGPWSATPLVPGARTALALTGNIAAHNSAVDLGTIQGGHYTATDNAALIVALVNNHATIIAALRELDAAHAREAKLREPEWFYNADDGEYTYGDVNDTVDDMGYEGVMRVGGAREVWVKWAAVKCVALDPDGEVDETEVHTFDTEAEALRCWPDSLAACRARAALGGAG